MVDLRPNTNIFTQPQQFGIGDLISLIRLQNEQAADTKARAMPGASGSGQSGTPEASSESSFPKIVGGASAGATGASSDVMNAVHGAWSNQGASPHAIAGVMANIAEESSFNPTLRHPDQPAYGGEAHFAHGLYQEGGAEWNNYSKWLQQNHPGADWRDAGMQSQFAAYRLRTGYPSTWQKMNNAKSPSDAASIYAQEYLKPAAKYLSSRVGKFKRQGVPGLDAWMAKANVSRAKAEDEQPVKRFAQGGIVTEPTLAMIGENGPEAVVPLYNKEPNAGPKVWTQTAEQRRPVVNVPRKDDDSWIFDYPNAKPAAAPPEEHAVDPKDAWIFDYPNKEQAKPEKQYAGPEGGPLAGRAEDPVNAGQAKFNRYADAIEAFKKESFENRLVADLILGGPLSPAWRTAGVGGMFVKEGAQTLARPVVRAAERFAAEHPILTSAGKWGLKAAGLGEIYRKGEDIMSLMHLLAK